MTKHKIYHLFVQSRFLHILLAKFFLDSEGNLHGKFQQRLLFEEKEHFQVFTWAKMVIVLKPKEDFEDSYIDQSSFQEERKVFWAISSKFSVSFRIFTLPLALFLSKDKQCFSKSGYRVAWVITNMIKIFKVSNFNRYIMFKFTPFVGVLHRTMRFNQFL